MSPNRTFRVAVLAVAGLNVLGAVGYRAIEGWPWLDCFYMTFLTLATIGFSEVHPLSDAGRIFTMVLFWTTASVIAVALSTAGQSLLQSELLATLGRRRKVFKDIGKLRGHYIVCGAGRVGWHVIKEMARRGVGFVVIEKDEDRAEKLLAQRYLVLMGDASDEETLQGAGIEQARGIVCCLPTDADNLYAVITARGLNPHVYIVARANEQAAISKLQKAGANKIISPVLMGGRQIAQAVLSPAVSDFIELATMAEGLDLVMEQVEISADSTLVGKTLKESAIRQEHDVIVIAIKPGQQQMLFNPSVDAVIAAGDVLVAVGSRVGPERLASVANPRGIPAKSSAH
jgi:voltage-gated potassium channel